MIETANVEQGAKQKRGFSVPLNERLCVLANNECNSCS